MDKKTSTRHIDDPSKTAGLEPPAEHPLEVQKPPKKPERDKRD